MVYKEVREQLELKGEHLSIFVLLFEGKKTINNEIMVFLNLVLEPLTLCNGVPNQP
jgi:hypothetical protein